MRIAYTLIASILLTTSVMAALPTTEQQQAFNDALDDATCAGRMTAYSSIFKQEGDLNTAKDGKTLSDVYAKASMATIAISKLNLDGKWVAGVAQEATAVVLSRYKAHSWTKEDENDIAECKSIESKAMQLAHMVDTWMAVN